MKTLQPKIHDSDTFQRIQNDYENILAISASQANIPPITLSKSTKILKSIRPGVSDFYGISAKHFLYAGEIGLHHFHSLMSNLIDSIASIEILEVNIVHAIVLFKGHSKEKNLQNLTERFLHVLSLPKL